MIAPPLTPLMTAEEFAELPDDGRLLELVEGKINEMPPAATNHSAFAIWLAVLLSNFVVPRNPGTISGEQGGYLLQTDPDIVRAPDVAFMTWERRRKQGPYLVGGPDLVIEVVSPRDSAADIQIKIAQYMAAGTRLMWVFYPQTRSVMVHLPDGSARMITAPGVLDGGDVLPGFTLALEEAFAFLDSLDRPPQGPASS